MAERPIIFSAPMVRAILAGRKTMTRRLAWRLGSPSASAKNPYRERNRVTADGSIERCFEIWSPWMRTNPGDRLWVREAWSDVNTESGPALLFRADGNYRWCDEDAYPVEYERYPGCIFATWGADLLRGVDGRWRPSIHMPRWASRITLEVTGVKVERLQDITNEDALAEGALESELPYVGAMTCDQARVAFSLLWDSLHGKLSWEQNPEVVCISFKRVRPNGEHSTDG